MAAQRDIPFQEARGLLAQSPDSTSFSAGEGDADLESVASTGPALTPRTSQWRGLRPSTGLAGVALLLGAAAALYASGALRGGGHPARATPLAAGGRAPMVKIEAEETAAISSMSVEASTTMDLLYQQPTETSTSTTGSTTTSSSSTQTSSTSTTWSTTSWTSTSTTGTQTVTTTAPPGPSPTLFCWSHMQPGTDEEDLIRYQLKRRANIFACNDYAVISTKSIEIGTVNESAVMTWINEAPKVTMGKYGINGQKTDSFLNTQTFLLAWDTLMGSGKLWPFDFVVKVDPDAVFFPDRLRKHMKKHTGENVYVPNCGKWGSGPKLYGSIEVFSVPALQTYQKRVQDCKNLPWKGWGEDYYMQHCMDLIGVQMAPDFDQVGDERCVAAPCSDWTKVAYHDFKKPAEWQECFEEAISR